jgi:alanyl-tRNA synthetase
VVPVCHFQLQLSKAEEQLTEKRDLLNQMESAYKEAQLAKIQQLEEEWLGIENELKDVIQQQLDEGDDEETENEVQVETDEAVQRIRSLLRDKKYKEAFMVCRQMKDGIEEVQGYEVSKVIGSACVGGGGNLNNK